MTKIEFLEKLRSALGNDLSGSIIQENVDYYNEYITNEVRNGRSEAEVIAELGDPWVIARTIIDSVENRSDEVDNTYDTGNGYDGYGRGERDYNGNIQMYRLNTWWKHLLVILGIVGIIVIIVAVIGGLVSLLAPLLIPIIIVMIVVRLLGNR
jgi:hypothetical protein